MQPFVYLITFFTLAPLTLAISLFSLFSLKTEEPQNFNLAEKSLIEVPRFGVQVFAALPEQQSAVMSSITSADARIEIIKQYLAKYNSPLEVYAPLIVSVADQYQLDSRIIVAIAQQESNLCKKIPGGTFNCWGWGIHSRGTLGFPDYPTAIQTVSKGLREEYIDKGYTTVEQIMQKYTPLSNGSWASGVSQFMAEME